MQQLNLYIYSEKPLLVCGLKHFLKSQFGTLLNIKKFYDRKSCLRKINKQTSIVIVDDDGKTTSTCMERSIRMLHPGVEIIEHSSNERIAEVIKQWCTRRDQTIKEDSLYKATWN